MIILIDKPKGWTSHDVVAKIRAILHEKKVGHAGTLDPNATGLLIIGTNKDTKKLEEITKDTVKTYEAEIILGETRDTDDVEGRIISKKNYIPEKEEVEKVIKSFIGEIKQTPPIYSAIKIKGKKAYELARNGKIPEIKKRNVNIYEIKIIKYKYPALKMTCKVSAGTYIRSLARDIGEKLKTGAYLNELKRIQIGKYQVEKAISLQKLQQLQKSKQQQR